MEQNSHEGPYDRVILRLKEREKELKCIYRVEEILTAEPQTLDEMIKRLLVAIPTGWQHTTLCEVRIIFEGKVYRSPDFRETTWIQHAEIVLDQNVAGRIDVVYTQNINEDQKCPFLPEEQKLLKTIADTLGYHIFIRRLRATLDSFRNSPASVPEEKPLEPILSPDSDLHWKWRRRQAETIAEHMDFQRFGVRGVYLIGSTKNATAGPASDIDLLIHFQGNTRQRECLETWLEGWSLSLAEVSFLNTGHRPAGGLLDVHFISDEDIRKKTSYAVMIGSIENSARPLRVISDE